MTHGIVEKETDFSIKSWTGRWEQQGRRTPGRHRILKGGPDPGPALGADRVHGIDLETATDRETVTDRGTGIDHVPGIGPTPILVHDLKGEEGETEVLNGAGRTRADVEEIEIIGMGTLEKEETGATTTPDPRVSPAHHPRQQPCRFQLLTLKNPKSRGRLKRSG